MQPAEAAKRFDDFDLAKFVVVSKCDLKKCHLRMQNMMNFIVEYKVRAQFGCGM